ncbi:papilin isoform X4 [Alligator mississippiensis]|uniref:papilin isoform X4 n=1 Tax=Alligator mississippiensis TaxID=8496 RepID=UPI00090759CF|nr:papilin isoform X4 [Alligator mississippiensis]
MKKVIMKNVLLLLTLVMMSPSASSTRKVKRQNDVWGSWGEWHECSRTCGGGISFRQRLCHSQRTDGGSSCVGPSASYRSCNIQSCPEDSRDFRAEQCAEFDGVEFQGKRYKWLPYYGAPSKCELNCIPKGENFYYRHKAAVVDGTPCEPGKQDVCVQGVCQAVGCDNMLDSAKKEDKCLQCGGDGRACYEVKGTFDVPNLPKGYNQIFIIPVGATSIRIKEVEPTRNFLAIKNAQGKYYLNGHWTIDFSRALHIASTVVHYDRGSEGDLAPELLYARGPTTEPLVIELISQETNQGVQYEYYLPWYGQNTGYSWSYGSWSECSSVCGGGFQSRLVFCTIDNEVYPDYMCRDKPKPVNNRTCGHQNCPQTKRISYIYLPGVWKNIWSSWKKSWKTGEWGPCSATCGGGLQTRSIYCTSHDERSFEEVVDDGECAALTQRPRAIQSCSVRQCATWSTGPWSECSMTCGEGIQTRSVVCRSEQGAQTLDVACLQESKPVDTQPCLRERCLQEIGWHVGDWGLCSKSCGSGFRTRQVICADGESRLYSPEACQAIQPQVPARLENCNTQPCHLPQQVPSMQNTVGYDISRQFLLIRYHPDSTATVHRDERTNQGSLTRHQTNEDRGSNFLPLHVESRSIPSGSQQFSSFQDISPGNGPQVCNQGPHGCCPDGRTPASGPFGQGCSTSMCHQSRYGCCPDGISTAQGPSNMGCPEYYSDAYASRDGLTTASPAHQSDECRGSMYGCCYDKVASASGPEGEGCLHRPWQPYPVRCLLPSAHGPCVDWTVRWYFITVVGKCNRFWYGGCHGNQNNFVSEEECMTACRRSVGATSGGHRQHSETLHVHSGSHLQKVSAQGQQQPLARGTMHQGQGGEQRSSHFALVRPASHAARQDTELHHREGSWRRVMNFDMLLASPQRLGTVESQRGGPHHAAVSGERKTDGLHSLGETVVPGHSERQVVQHVGERWQSSSEGDASAVDGFRRRALAGSSSLQTLNRVIVEGVESSLVEAAVGQNIRLLCKTGTSHFSRAEWQKDGWPVSSTRHTYQSDSSLVVSQVRPEDAGTYTCIISDGRMERREIRLRIKEGHGSALAESRRGQHPSEETHPHRDLSREVKTVHVPSSSVYQQPTYRLIMAKEEPSAVDANIGERVRLPCQVEASPALTIQWQKDGQPLSSPRHRQQADGALVISRVSATDAGFFTCTASNGRDQDQHRVQLRPIGELRITGLLPSITVTEGEDTQLRCTVTGNKVTVRWSRNGVPVRADGHHVYLSQDGSLIINNAQAGDEGSYTCSAYRGSNSVSASTEVKVVRSSPEGTVNHVVDLSRECVDQPHLANCDLILQAQLCSNEYYSSFCCASCSQYQGSLPQHQG